MFLQRIDGLAFIDVFLLSKNGLRYLLYPFMSFWMVGGRISPSFTSALSREFSRILRREGKHDEREHASSAHVFTSSFSLFADELLSAVLITEEFSDPSSSSSNQRREREAHFHNWITLIRQCEERLITVWVLALFCFCSEQHIFIPLISRSESMMSRVLHFYSKWLYDAMQHNTVCVCAWWRHYRVIIYSI